MLVVGDSVCFSQKKKESNTATLPEDRLNKKKYIETQLWNIISKF